MSEPKDAAEYKERFAANQKFTGTRADTTCHVPCPFCAAPDFLVHRVIESQTAYSNGATCSVCNRSCKAIFTERERGHMTFEFVQTGGPDQPDWLVPQMRRV